MAWPRSRTGRAQPAAGVTCRSQDSHPSRPPSVSRRSISSCTREARGEAAAGPAGAGGVALGADVTVAPPRKPVGGGAVEVVAVVSVRRAGLGRGEVDRGEPARRGGLLLAPV